ncbi:MAG: hypothetical protein ABR575_00310, partial [Actinomycetota bacterium]
AATAEAPVEVELDTGPGVGSGRSGPLAAAVSHAFHNLQVDSAAAETGLWASIEFPAEWDYDMYMDLPDGTNVAESGGFLFINDNLDVADDEDSHSDVGSETILGTKTADCGGYTLEVVGATTAGGPVTLKLWLGEIAYVP